MSKVTKGLKVNKVAAHARTKNYFVVFGLWYHVLWCDILWYLVMSCIMIVFLWILVIPCLMMSCNSMIPCNVMCCDVLWCHDIWWWHILRCYFYDVFWCYVMSYVLWCLLMSWSPVMSCLKMSCFIMSCDVMLNDFMSHNVFLMILLCHILKYQTIEWNYKIVKLAVKLWNVLSNC